MNAQRVVIAGGSGFLGLNLARHLANLDYAVVVLSRHATQADARWQHARWDARTVGAWIEHLEGASAVVNLAGRSVDCVKTPDHCDEILRSRVESTLVLGEALRQLDSRLHHETVGFEHVAPGLWSVFFGDVMLGRFSELDYRFVAGMGR